MKSPALALSALLALAGLPSASYAQLAFNVGATSDYRYRGISQTRVKPAIQGGVDFAAGGFYVGAWASSIKWIEDAGGDAKVELDLYGGYKGTIIKDTLSYDVGVLSYVYPSNKLKPITGADADTTEIYAALTYGPATLKYSHAVTDTFAAFDSKNSYYLDLSASFDLGGGLMLAPHVGHQRYKGPLSGLASYWDYSLTLSKDFNGLVPSVALIANSKIQDAYYTVKGKDLAKTTLVVGVKYNF
jgi:uncharacterized protein (TIGR02001 family)